MFDHAYQNYMVGDAFAGFLYIFLFFYVLWVFYVKILFIKSWRTMRTQLMSWCRWHAEEEFGVWNQVEVMWTTPSGCEWNPECLCSYLPRYWSNEDACLQYAHYTISLCVCIACACKQSTQQQVDRLCANVEKAKDTPLLKRFCLFAGSHWHW